MAEQWLCIRVPQLPLEIFTLSGDEEQALAVCDRGRRASVLFCSQAARASGVCPGMPVASARALLQDLIIRCRDQGAEQEALQSLAAWAYQFSSQVSLHPPCALLLEIQGSLTLFGGRAALLESLRTGLTGLGYETCLAVAPTPLAASSLACLAGEQYVEALHRLPAALAPVPVSVLNWEPGLIDRLHGMGVRRLGDLLRLPRDGLARRLGPARVLYLDRMLGRHPDPQVLYQPPLRFRRRVQLSVEVEQAHALLFVLQHVLLELCGYLQGQGAGIQKLELRLWHREARHTGLWIGVRKTSRDAEQFTTLLRERLQGLALKSPVYEVELRADQLFRLHTQPQDLFGGRREQGQIDLLDRLRARLGDEAVRGLSAVAEHRPEYAWQYSEPGQSEQKVNGQQRPLWLLPVAKRLEIRDGRPYLGGRLELQAGCERIDTGWWEDQGIARDYFIAVNPSGSRFWIYRELRGEGRWFVQGVFE